MQNGTDRKRVIKYISDCLGKRAWRLCCFIVKVRNCRTDFPNFWWIVCSRWRRSAHGQWRTVLYYKRKRRKRKKKKKKEKRKEKKDPKCTASHLPVFQCEHCTCDQSKKRTVSETQRCCVTKPYFYRARELWADEFTESVHNSLTQNCRLNGRDCQA